MGIPIPRCLITDLHVAANAKLVYALFVSAPDYEPEEIALGLGLSAGSVLRHLCSLAEAGYIEGPRFGRQIKRGPKNNRECISPKLRFSIYKRDGFGCTYCGRRGGPNVELCLDHVVPFSKGGGSSTENLVTSCVPCNFGKGSDPLEVS